jgi:pyrophosphatase PpaX
LPGPWRGVFFDLDGTLADTVELILQSYRHTMRTHLGEALPDERWLATIGQPLRAQLREFARDEGEAGAMLETYSAFQREVHDDMVRPFPGAVEVLRKLREKGTRVAVVTSKRTLVARRTMDVCGLSGTVEVLVGADDVTSGKPHPEAVVRALAAVGLAGREREVLFVGDSPFDLRAGRSAGTLTAGVAWGAFAPEALAAEEPDYLLETIDEVLAIGPRSD